ncbi:hypothetical protein [Phormidium sp. CCY1219]|uniref:hypothetical protein n=1 Tax=Phormidium sp. CCY1219 TaxID=2886104 RepID=UPI002D1E4E49|nr:hypothetical protein [Phormidium sp. CCY1219]MEB3831420.1 hypothetical protein [Phormidium sp. CCY1219]
MYYAYLTESDNQFQELFPQGVPTWGLTPDDFIEIYDSCGCELIDIEPAFRVNIAGLTPEQELKLFQEYASTMNDPRFVRGMFKLMENGWMSIPESLVQFVVWRDRQEVFCFKVKDKNFGTDRLVK